MSEGSYRTSTVVIISAATVSYLLSLSFIFQMGNLHCLSLAGQGRIWEGWEDRGRRIGRVGLVGEMREGLVD